MHIGTDETKYGPFGHIVEVCFCCSTKGTERKNDNKLEAFMEREETRDIKLKKLSFSHQKRHIEREGGRERECGLLMVLNDLAKSHN